jgi:hypothetical protein
VYWHGERRIAWNASIEPNDTTAVAATTRRDALLERFRDELACDHRGHRARVESERRGKNAFEGVDEEKCRHREKRLSEA